MKKVFISLIIIFVITLISYGSDHRDDYTANYGVTVLNHYTTGQWNDQEGWQLPTGEQLTNYNGTGFSLGVDVVVHPNWTDTDHPTATAHEYVSSYGTHYGELNTATDHPNTNGSWSTYYSGHADKYFLSISVDTYKTGQDAHASVYVNW